jgi:hypothetical protein
MANQWYANQETTTEVLDHGYQVNLAGRLALELVEKWGMVTGRREGEDSSGRAILAEMPVPQVIERAFSLAEGCIAELEARGWIRETELSPESVMRRAGELGRVREDALYSRTAGKRSAHDEIADLIPAALTGG